MINEELVQEYQNGNKRAIDALLENNGGIIAKISNKYLGVCSNTGIEFDDLFNSGVLGLMYAAEKYNFDIDNKAQFITYAVHYINRYILTCINGRSSKDIENTKLNKNCKSLNTPIKNDGDNEDEIGDFIGEDDSNFENMIEKEFRKTIRIELEDTMNNCLSLKEKEVIKFIYGWDCKVMSLEDIAGIWGTSRNRVWQVKENALRKMRTTAWWKEKGRHYARELKGLVWLGNEKSNKALSQDTIEGNNFINSYFSELMGA